MLYQPIILGMENKMSNIVTQKDVDLAEKAYQDEILKGRVQYWIRLVVGVGALITFLYIVNS